MITSARRQEIFKNHKLSTTWDGEPLLGSIYGEEEVEAAIAAIRDSMTPSRGFGFNSTPIQEFEKAFAEHVGTKHAITINSAGPGLDIAMKFLRLQPGDEVIVPAVNFVAAPMAVMGAGGQVIWGEVDPRTLQLDPNDVERRITPRTRAIFPVHMNGLSAPMDDYLELARRHPHEKHGPLAVVGDAARACGGSYRGTRIGKKGLMTIFSFHTMKNITTLGEGGMITTDDDTAAKFARATRFYGGGADEDLWGTSNVMTKVQAAVGLVQLRKLDGLVQARRRLAAARTALLEGVEEITPPFEAPDCEHSFYLYTCQVKDEWAGEKRDRLIQMLREEFSIRCIVANPPVYQMRKIMREHTPGQHLPLSEKLGRQILCVPLHPSMSDEENEHITAALIECVCRLK